MPRCSAKRSTCPCSKQHMIVAMACFLYEMLCTLCQRHVQMVYVAWKSNVSLWCGLLVIAERQFIPVSVTPPVAMIPLGSDAMFRCEYSIATYDAVTKVSWSRLDLIQMRDNYEQSPDMHTLTVHNVSLLDTGSVQCSVSTLYGSGFATAYLQVGKFLPPILCANICLFILFQWFKSNLAAVID